MFRCSIRVPYFQASKLNPGNHVQLHATLGLKMYIQLLMECCRTPSWSHCPPSPVVDFNIKRFPSFEGPEATRLVFTGIQIVVNFWLFHISIGIGDTIANPKVMSYIIQHIGEKKQQNLKEDNNIKQMVTAGSKGSYINISQMLVCVGQQSMEGCHIPFGFPHRMLPHFMKDDFSPKARGFVENSYLRGMMPQEYFFHAMAGQEGLIDTAIKTVETGYIQRHLVKALEDVMVCYDGTMQNFLGDLIQFIYGEDGMDGTFIERQKIETFGMSDREFEHNYQVYMMDKEDPHQ
ncbi:hypothetical protein EV363DRAFT_1540617 [Boletus edulis]|nr:hypothetical protein EV363DRAFT_1540617 [Boletus edulis]